MISAARLGEQSAVEFIFVYRNPILASRSSVGVGITPPKVLAAPNPVSSVMISRMFGAPLGGTICGGHHGFDSAALRLITPPNFIAGAGSTFELGKTVALGEPGTPVISCCARAAVALSSKVAKISFKMANLNK